MVIARLIILGRRFVSMAPKPCGRNITSGKIKSKYYHVSFIVTREEQCLIAVIHCTVGSDTVIQ